MTDDAAQRGHLVGGMLLALAAIACTCVGVVLAKPALASGHLVEITWTRLVAGTVVQAVVTFARGGQADAMQAFVQRDTWRHMVPGALVGTYLSLLLWLGGFKWGDASVASVLNQMATVYMLVLARVVLGEELRLALVELRPFAQASDGHARTDCDAHSSAPGVNNASERFRRLSAVYV